ncbi:hypothetical protein N1851_011128 [Merluccius polli]|uniref:Uncharacterized protein n=1 Tax=Merluccius polli TaxID=89951 RepID=A0AA47MXW7_MERPO|nr:hypothetical protein N1851_011128 [Merluccius polli]
MLEELAPNLWEDDLNFGHLINAELEMPYVVYVSRERGLLTQDEKLWPSAPCVASGDGEEVVPQALVGLGHADIFNMR